MSIRGTLNLESIASNANLLFPMVRLLEADLRRTSGMLHLKFRQEILDVFAEQINCYAQ